MLLGLPNLCSAATFEVTTLLDEGVGSLRAAIGLANATDEPDVIIFSAGENGSLNFHDGITRIIAVDSTLEISRPLEIRGPGKELLVIDGGGNGDFVIEAEESRVFLLEGSTSLNPHCISDLTISNGTAELGGANIRAFGSLELVSCRLSGGRGVAEQPNIMHNSPDNADGGGLFHSGGNLLVESCDIIANGSFGNFSQGGGLYSENGQVNLVNSRIVANFTNGMVGEGGGIGLRSNTVMEGCEVSENETLGASSGGGGIYTDDTFLARHTTISNNVVGALTGIGGYSVGGAFASVGSGNARFESCTIVGNEAPPGTGQGGGISSVSSGSFLFFATILIGNEAVDLERIPNATTSFIDLGHNLFGLGAALDLIAQPQITSVYGIDSTEGVVSELALHGGRTRTHRLLSGTTAASETGAIDGGPTRTQYQAVTGENPLFDQRGGDFPRVVGPRLDVGAYEFQAFLDGDDDGLPDAVEEIVVGLDPALPDSDGDLDRDGISNLGEYKLSGIAAMSDANLALRLSFKFEEEGDEVVVCFPASLNREYRLRGGSELSLALPPLEEDFRRFTDAGEQELVVPLSEQRLFFQLEGRVPNELLEIPPF